MPDRAPQKESSKKAAKSLKEKRQDKKAKRARNDSIVR
jgi:hypothetical protein